MTIVATLGYPTAGDVLIPPWQAEQQPRVRGVEQNRITIVTGASVPGAGAYKPTGAMRVELRPYYNNDVTVTSTDPADAAATTLTLTGGTLFDKDFLYNNRTGEILRVNGTPAGTTVAVRRGMPNTTAAAILAGDTFTVPGGDVNDSQGDYATSRAEVFARFATDSNVPPASWPDPAGSERWYEFSVYVPADYPLYTDRNWWQAIMQFKGVFGGSPPLSLGVYRDRWRVEGTKGQNTEMGTIAKGAWTRWLIGMKLSPDPAVGWLEVWRNTTPVLPRRSQATMDYKSDGVTADPIYVKHGVYRTQEWTDTHVLHYSPLVIADSSLDFGIAASPPVVPSSGGNAEYWGVRA